MQLSKQFEETIVSLLPKNIDSRDLHQANDRDPNFEVERGIDILDNLEHFKNAFVSISSRQLLGSNSILFRISLEENASMLILATEDGMI